MYASCGSKVMVVKLYSKIPLYHDISYHFWFGGLKYSVTRNNAFNFSLTTRQMLTGLLFTMVVNKCIAAHKIV